MEIINRVPRMASIAREMRAERRTIGFVPTMGALHDGHLSLMMHAREMCNILIISIFVNPTQFGPKEDFNRYPKDLARDSELAFARGVDFVFAPTVNEMYPDGFSTSIHVDHLTDSWEGASRPGHFNGVTTVVTKLFNIIHPHFAFFGQKDAQQFIVIRRMVHDLSMDVELVACPTVRESDGLALSSRNAYLSREEREAAPILKRALDRCGSSYESGIRETDKLIAAMNAVFEAVPQVHIDCIAITDTARLEPLTTIGPEQPALVSMAVKIGSTRLIDNIVLNGEL